MSDVFAVEKGLPPGLWLPTHDESTEKYLAENYAGVTNDYEDIVDLGTFAVSMVILGGQDDRISTMPKTQDFEELHDAGYGLSPSLLTKKSGGLRLLQLSLGYYPDGWDPTKQELLQRFQWIADYAYQRDEEQSPQNANIDDIIHWGAARDYIPGFNRTRKILDGDTTILRTMFKNERRHSNRTRTKQDVYRLGDQIILEHGGPITEKAMQHLYASDFSGSPSEAITQFFGTYTKFWREYDYLPTTSGLSKQDLAVAGARWLIQNGHQSITPKVLDEYSAQQKLPSRFPISRLFRSIPIYREEVEKIYQQYVDLKTELEVAGVTEPVIKAVCRRFDPSTTFLGQLMENVELLKKISVDTPEARYVQGILSRGFSLTRDEVYEFQVKDLKKSLRILGIKGTKEKRFIAGHIPRIEPKALIKR